MAQTQTTRKWSKWPMYWGALVAGGAVVLLLLSISMLNQLKYGWAIGLALILFAFIGTVFHFIVGAFLMRERLRRGRPRDGK